MRFNVVAEHIPGKKLVVADALFRHPLDGEQESETVDQVRAYVNTVVVSKRIKPPKIGPHRMMLNCKKWSHSLEEGSCRGWQPCVTRVCRALGFFF